MSEGSSACYPEGVVDVSIIVVSLFRNPLEEEAVKFLRDVLSRRTKAAIPVTSVLGAFHVATRYLKLPVASVEEKLVKMLETKSPAFYSRASLEAISAIKYATLFRVESWDGYIIELARSLGNHIVYTLDRELERIKDIVVVNPFPENLVKEYHEYIESRIKRRESH
ncbi:MAG: hypothetical protein HA491_00280 [Candidatus Verstraetearchaeota archaeon]|nr:hypothetical protein [Candidatus Verstraetearchaeota archaeon]